MARALTNVDSFQTKMNELNKLHHDDDGTYSSELALSLSILGTIDWTRAQHHEPVSIVSTIII